MLKKTAILVSVFVGLVLGGALIYGLTQWSGERDGPVTTAEEAPGAFNPDEAGGEIEVRRIGSGSGYWVQQTDPETHRIIREFRYEKLDPEAEGHFNVADPEARLYVDARRVVRMRARSGFIVAPDRMPQQGRFSDGVTIEVFAAEPGERPRVSSDSPDRLFALHLEEARFNTLLGKIDSDGPVTLDSAEARFSGRGLTLVYDEVQRRIDYLRIEEGDYLVYEPGEGAVASGGSEAGGGGSPGLSIEGPGGERVTAGAAGPSDDVQYYKARFERSVEVRQGKREINADVLEATFALARSQRDEAAGIAPGHAVGAGEVGAGAEGSGVRSDAAREGNAGGETARSPREELEAAGREALTLRWSGPLTLEPLAAGPARLAGPDDAVLVFDGSPVDLRDGEGGRLVGERAAYQRSTAAVSAVGSAAYPLRVTAPTLGELECISVDLNLRTGEGKLWGAGAIRGRPTVEPDAAAARGLPPGFAVRWDERVDLKLTAEGVEPAGLERATFVGEVEVEDRRFSMSGHELAVAFEPETGAGAGGADEGAAEPGGGRRLASIEAEAKSVGPEAERAPVRFVSREGRASAERFAVALMDHEGQTLPRRLQAWGGVRLADAQRRLAAELLDVTFRPTERADGGEAAGAAGAGVERDAGGGALTGGEALAIGEGDAAFEVATVRAEGAVELAEASGSRVRAEKLLADADRDAVELWGEPLVIVEQEGATLRVPRLSVREGGAKAIASGAGRFEYTRADEAKGAAAGDAIVADTATAAGGDGAEDAPEAPRRPERLDVRWAETMTFDDAEDLLTVEGEVVAVHEDRPDHANRLEAERVTLELVRRAAVGGEDRAAADEGPLASQRALLETLVAERNVVVQATRWAAADRKRVVGRLRIAGPRLTFDNPTQRVVVEGSGSMLIEDYSEAEGRRGLGDTRLSGRGKTLFTWLGRLVLDGAENDVIIERAANMTHKPTGEDRVVDLQAHKLVADMAGLDGVGALQMSRFEDLKIDELIADRDVQIRDGDRVVTAGHARYIGSERVVRLDAAAGDMVEVVKLDEPRPLRAERIRWDLRRDRVEVVRGEY